LTIARTCRLPSLAVRAATRRIHDAIELPDRGFERERNVRCARSRRRSTRRAVESTRRMLGRLLAAKEAADLPERARRDFRQRARMLGVLAAPTAAKPCGETEKRIEFHLTDVYEVGEGTELVRRIEGLPLERST
jgi:hypothetical protein